MLSCSVQMDYTRRYFDSSSFDVWILSLVGLQDMTRRLMHGQFVVLRMDRLKNRSTKVRNFRFSSSQTQPPNFAFDTGVLSLSLVSVKQVLIQR
jgi:hypothetical protein